MIVIRDSRCRHIVTPQIGSLRSLSKISILDEASSVNDTEVTIVWFLPVESEIKSQANSQIYIHECLTILGLRMMRIPSLVSFGTEELKMNLPCNVDEQSLQEVKAFLTSDYDFTAQNTPKFLI